VQIAPNINGAVRERLHSLYEDKAAAAYAKVITRYPMAPHVEDARDRLVAMNRAVPEPSDAAVAENDAEQKSMRPIRFTDNVLGIIKRGPTVVEAAHVGEPSLEDSKRTVAPDVSRENLAFFNKALNEGKPAAAA
jgi:outer membrane protein assembly factor BamD